MAADATTPSTPSPTGSETSPDEDTVAYAQQLVEAVDNLNHLAADIDHTCIPRWWPHHLGEHWRCECGHGFHVARAADMGDPTSAKAIRLGLLDPDTLGWQSDA